MKKVWFCALLSLAAATTVRAECPTVEAAAESLNKTIKGEIAVSKVQPTPVEGICEVWFKAGNSKNVLYLDAGGRFLLTGSLIDTGELVDLKKQSLAEYLRFTEEEMQKFEKLTALSIGESGPVVYFVTDPM